MKKILLAIVVLVFSVSGCAMQSEFVDLENEVNRMKVILLQTQRDVSTLQSKGDETAESDIQERFSKIESQSAGTIDMLQKNQADFEGRLTQLATDVQIIQGGVEENTHRLTELTESSDDHSAAIQEITRRLDNLETGKGGGNVPQDSTLIPAPPVTQAGQQPAPSNTARPSDSSMAAGAPFDLYNQGDKDYMAGNYDPAIEACYYYAGPL